MDSDPDPATQINADPDTKPYGTSMYIKQMKTMPVPLQSASSPCTPHSSNIQLNDHDRFATQLLFKPVLRIRIRMHRIHMFWASLIRIRIL
jgi:hypothetical protein